MTQLLEFLEEIAKAIDNGDEIDAIYLDFCKVFDKMPHKRLLKKGRKIWYKGEHLEMD